MLIYQLRDRTIALNNDGECLNFPGDGELCFTLLPAEPFGSAHGPSKTAVQGSGALVKWDANSDRGSVFPDRPLESISVELHEDNLSVEVRGNKVLVRRRFESLPELTRVIGALQFGLPLVLALHYIDTPTVSTVTGKIGDVEFTWQYARRSYRLETTNKELQEEKFRHAWRQLEFVLPEKNRRLFAALQYFQVACRLERAGTTPWEFTSEVLLNYAKILDALFPPRNAKTIEPARIGLRQLGYATDYIEQWFIPAIALRNSLDVAHVSLATFSRLQLRTLHDYTEQAEPHFGEMLRRTFDAITEGSFMLPAYSDHGPNRDAEITLRKLAEKFSLSSS